MKIDIELQTENNNKILAEARDANNVIHAVADTQDSLFFSSLIEDISVRRVPGMILTNFDLSHADGGAGSDSAHAMVNASTISISGMAATRDILVAFEQNLENDPRLTKVELPVSALAENTNINFTMNIQGVQ